MQRSHIFVQNRVFCLPRLHSTPPLWGFPSEYRHSVWHGKTRLALLPDGEKISKIFIRFYATHEGDEHTHTPHRAAKTETSLVTWLNIVTIVARSVSLLPTHMPKDVHATRQLHCQSWYGQCHAKHAANAASVHNTCLDRLLFTKNI